MLSVPVPRTHALQTIGDPRESGLQVIVELVSIALIGPMPNHAPFQAFNQCPLIETAQSGGQLMLHHSAPGIVGKAPLHLIGCITHLRQIARCVVAVAHQHFATLIRVQAFDAAQIALIADQLNLNQIERIAQAHQVPGFVIVEVDAVVVTITQLAQTQLRRVRWRSFEQAVHAVVAFDQQLPIEVSPHRKPFTGAEHCAAQGNGAHVDGPTLLIGIHQRFAALGMGLNVDAHLVRHTPADAKQAARALIATVVEALPVNRQDARQYEIQLLDITQYLRARRSMHRVRRTHRGVGRGPHRAADGHRSGAADQHARQLAEELALAPFEHQQRCNRQPDAGRLAAANFTHHYRTAADGHVGGNQPGRHHRRIAGTAITTAHGGLAVDGDLIRAFGQKLRRHRRVLHAHHQVQRLGHGARRRRCNGRAPHLREETLGHVQVTGFRLGFGFFQLGTGRRDMGADRPGGTGGRYVIGQGIGGTGENVRLHRGRKQGVTEGIA
ncbi:hypothetical protein [Pseudomonas sp. 58 R 3]|nr:hypothetical protein [Pseudomonas sp. 58 R 3]CRM80115.1 hypothetical protein [Pseudomonas sp. 58 R 3]